ncbi:ferric-dicitrate binding protein FerR (iron transport regulator) [Flavobacterium nitrogenifigens]|uniref:Ferric-dicitrate binding protein FerR (Iron transport regulator) n=2 Tax=Flavobacterium TaxID=237 RepID=A0A7W7J1N6_9FLAO|nr:MULTISPECIES: FecR domain-containing protein [Flavobacterium]MBB4804578.1 ferric-dicitrate binding protein FerR (iron transport regulator) [Flavobacterium nitrogenifigens]MBB6389537.1 ferric-dicitrate binding protein FerR (iron transport regulator) [Flavobacterium notoginsengisoli]
MNETEFLELLKKHQNDTLSDDDKDKLDAWYSYRVSTNSRSLNEYELEDSYEYLKTRLPLKKDAKVVALWPRIAVAASIVMLLGAGIFYFSQPKEIPVQVVEKTIDIAPGGNKGILTLSNGKQIVLSDISSKDIIAKEGEEDEVTIKMDANGVITYIINANADVSKENANLFNTLSTPTGGQYNIVLADGTKVFLNAVSSIKYPTQFNGDQRIVELDGEAYFEVAKNKNKPFIVKSVNQSIEVLGTHFNVHAYDNESIIKTTLLEGSVAITSKNQKVILKPGQQSNVSENFTKISVKEVDTEEAIAWKNGRFKFDNADLKSVMKQLERWYGIKVEYHGDVSDVRFNGGTFRNKNLSEVLKVLELNNIKFKTEGKTVIVYP